MRLPSPPAVPVLGHVPAIWNADTRLDAHMRFFRDHGDLVRLRMGPRDVYMAYAPAPVATVLHERSRDFPKSADYDKLATFLGNGLLTSSGDFWLRQRRMMQPHFHLAQIATLGEAMAGVTADVLAAWDARPTDVPFDVAAEMMGLTLRIVGKTLFGAELAGAAGVVGEALPFVLADTNRRIITLIAPPRWLPTPNNLRFRRALAQLDQVVFQVIAERRRQGGGGDDLLAMLLAAVDADSGEAMTDRQLRDEVMTLFLAGHETTANNLAWTWWLLARHPEVEAKLHAELDAVLGGRPPTFADLPALPYLAQVIDESLRLYPPAWYIERQAAHDDSLLGFDTPKGTVIGLVAYVVHRHPGFWDEPEAFRPERFAPGRGNDRHRFAYFPFGGGPRLCIGQSFALMEARLILAAIAQRYSLRLDPTRPVRPEPVVTLRPRTGVWVRAQRRS